MNVTKSPRRRRRGITLLEVLLATALLAAGLAALSTMLKGASQATMRVELESYAAIRCESAMDRLQAMPDEAVKLADQLNTNDPYWHYQISQMPSEIEGLNQWTIVVQSKSVPQLGRFEISRLLPSEITTARIPSAQIPLKLVSGGGL